MTIDKKERTNKIYTPNYVSEHANKKPEKQTFDTSDWPYRKFKIYEDFTKTFDKTTNIEK